MKALILSGGQGTRLRPFTLTSPKPLLPVANEPFLAYPMALLRKHGVREAVLCTSDRLEPYGKFIRDQKKLGTTVHCSRETRELGTAGALKNAEKFAGAETFVFNGDVMTDADLTGMLSFHRKNKSMITVALFPVPDPSAFGLVLTSPSGRISKFLEKQAIQPKAGKLWPINAGIYLFDRKIFARIPAGARYSTERQLFPECLAERAPMYGFRLKPSTYWLDIGTPEKYLQANRDVLALKLFPLGKARGENNRIDRGARIGANVAIGSRCRVGAGCVLDDCLLLDGVTVQEGAELSGCIVGNRAVIGRHARVGRGAALGDGSSVTPYSRLGA